MHTLQPTRTIRAVTQPTARCKGSAAQQTPLCPAGTPADGFLKHRFLPLCEPAKDLPEAKMAERGFFKSLGHLSGHYGLTPLEVGGFSYPANVLLSYWDVRRKLKIKGRYRDLLIGEQDGKVSLTVKETIDTGHTLFYIPVVPLCHWHSKRQNRKTAELLLSVCSYLYFEAGVPYFRDEDSYLGGSYAMMEDWITNDRGEMDEEDYQKHRSDLNIVNHFGDLMERRIKAKINLQKLAERVEAFKVRTPFQQDCLDLAKRTLAVWRAYPKANLYMNEHEPEMDDEDYDDDYYSYLHIAEYVGFIGKTGGHLYESMMDMANNDFNERSKVLEPQVATAFAKKPKKYADVLGYEAEVFDIISELSTLLDQLT